ncbi:MAG: class II aldolase and adducin N-terminal domain-containing protein [Paracoccaceae bacterium]
MDHTEMRRDLAAAFRWFARLGMHESVANHFSLATDPSGETFLMNPRGLHFSRIRASDLLLLDTQDQSAMERASAPDPTAWFIHSAIHRRLPHARCVMHLHPKFATTLAALADSTMLPVDQNTMRFFNRVAVDDGFGGMALSSQEGERLAGCLGQKSVLLMGNHGVLVAAPTVAEAFDTMYYYERACDTLITAMSTGRPLRIASDEVAERTAEEWEAYTQLSFDHLRQVRRILDIEEPDYRF